MYGTCRLQVLLFFGGIYSICSCYQFVACSRGIVAALTLALYNNDLGCFHEEQLRDIDSV